MNMGLYNWSVGALFLAGLSMLATGCMKDGVLPPTVSAEGDVSLRVEFVNGTTPFTEGMWSTDGTGAQVRFTTLKFYISGIGLYDSDSARVAGITSTELLLDASRSGTLFKLGRISNGHIELFQFVPGLDRTFSCETSYPHGHPYTDPSMMNQGGSERLHVHMTGYLDGNGNGSFEPGIDTGFDYRLTGGEVRPLRHFHMHADMVDGKDLTLGVQVDLRILFLAVNIAETPTSNGNDQLSEQILNNLAVAVAPKL
jgi:hypothetical protein